MIKNFSYQSALVFCEGCSSIHIQSHKRLKLDGEKGIVFSTVHSLFILQLVDNVLQ